VDDAAAVRVVERLRDVGDDLRNPVQESGSFSRISCFRFFPSTYSMAMKDVSSSRPRRER